MAGHMCAADRVSPYNSRSDNRHSLTTVCCRTAAALCCIWISGCKQSVRIKLHHGHFMSGTERDQPMGLVAGHDRENRFIAWLNEWTTFCGIFKWQLLKSSLRSSVGLDVVHTSSSLACDQYVTQFAEMEQLVHCAKPRYTIPSHQYASISSQSNQMWRLLANILSSWAAKLSTIRIDFIYCDVRSCALPQCPM